MRLQNNIYSFFALLFLFTVLRLPVQAAPVIVSVFPAVGLPVAGGTIIDIFGNNFGSSGATVTIGGVSASVFSQTDTLVRATTPPGVGANLNLVVTVSGTPSNAHSVSYAPPEIASVSPSSNLSTSGGQSMIIQGNHFGISGTSVTVGGNSAPITTQTNTQLTVTTPAGVGTGNAVVVTVGGQSSTGGVTVDYGAPTIVGVNPVSVSGKGGTPVVISGLNFGATPGQVSFGGVPATPTAWSHTAIQVTSPLIPSGEEAALVITQAGQSSPAFALTVARSLDDPISQTLDETGTPELVFDFGDIELEIQFEGVTGSGTVTVNAVPGNAAPAGKNPANFITMRWEISATPGLTFTYATLVFTFGDDVLNGMNRSELFVVFRDSGGNLTRYTGVVNLAERTVTVTGVTGFSTWYISDEDTTSVSDWSLLD